MSRSTQPAAGAIGPKRVMALYSFEGQSQDELTFNEGDILEVIEEDQSGWWRCSLLGKIGWVPANYVELVPN